MRFACPGGCTSTFVKTADLKHHWGVFHEAKLLNCTESGCMSKPFASAGTFVRHMRTVHSSENKYKCSMRNCTYETNRSDALKAHVARPHGNLQYKRIKPSRTTKKRIARGYECSDCNERFDFSVLLKLHVRNQHSKNNELASALSVPLDSPSTDGVVVVPKRAEIAGSNVVQGSQKKLSLNVKSVVPETECNPLVSEAESASQPIDTGTHTKQGTDCVEDYWAYWGT